MIALKAKIKIAFPTLLSLALLFVFTDRTVLCAVILSTVFHEVGHILAAFLLKIKINCFSVDLLGARLDTERTLLSYTDEIILSASGPFINILSVIAFHGTSLPFFVHFTVSSLSLAILNLLPIETFDGGRILYCLTAKLSSSDKAAVLLRAMSFVFLFILWCVSVYFLIKNASSLSLFTFSLTLFNRLFLHQ